jgi:hypothetical protein
MGVCVVKGSVEVAETISPENFLRCTWLRAGPLTQCANGTVTYFGNCTDGEAVGSGQLYYAGTASEVRPAHRVIVMHYVALQTGAREEAANFIAREPCQAMVLLCIATL